jgi:hypothetical protein
MKVETKAMLYAAWITAVVVHFLYLTQTTHLGDTLLQQVIAHGIALVLPVAAYWASKRLFAENH